MIDGDEHVCLDHQSRDWVNDLDLIDFSVWELFPDKRLVHVYIQNSNKSKLISYEKNVFIPKNRSVAHFIRILKLKKLTVEIGVESF